MLEIRTLEGTNYELIADCFDRAFADYYLKAKRSSRNWLENRCKKNGVDLGVSVGAFAGDEMVGFTLIGLGRFAGVSAAFDAGTGIIPEYRKQGLANRMFDFSLPHLRETGCERFYLEVLQQNNAAIGTYTKAGFSVTRDFDCYTLARERIDASRQSASGVEIREVDRQKVVEFGRFLEWEPSWETNMTAVTRVPDELVTLGAWLDNECAGVIAYYPLLNWILCVAVDPEKRRKRVGSALVGEIFRRFEGRIDTANLVNVESSDVRASEFLKNNGGEIYAQQHEMMFSIAE